MKKVIRYVLLAEAFAVATYAVGWWSVPIVGAGWALLTGERHAARNSALCAAAGWGTLLLLDAIRGPVATMAEQLGIVFKIPGVGLIALTLLFAALLAWSAAELFSRLRKTTA
jgi:hypothetical protein